jgi:phage-related tail fiber protein
MSVSTTTNYKLKKPSDDEFYDVSRYRDNMDAIDAQMKTNADAAASALNAAQNVDISGKADKATTIAGYGITDAYTQVQTDNLLKDKADKATTIAGYGVTDAYTKTETDTLLKAKANTTTVVTYTLKSGSWANSQYSLESAYPSASYDVEVGINGDSATDAQYKAWAALKPMDSASNILKIKGKTPTIDIPVLLKVVKK